MIVRLAFRLEWRMDGCLSEGPLYMGPACGTRPLPEPGGPRLSQIQLEAEACCKFSDFGAKVKIEGGSFGNAA